MPEKRPKKATRKSAKGTTANRKAGGFTAEERAAMKEYAQELKVAERGMKSAGMPAEGDGVGISIDPEGLALADGLAVGTGLGVGLAAGLATQAAATMRMRAASTAYPGRTSCGTRPRIIMLLPSPLLAAGRGQFPFRRLGRDEHHPCAARTRHEDS